MPYQFSNITSKVGGYISVDGELSTAELAEIVKLGELDLIQCTHLPSVKTLALLNDLYFAQFPNTAFRLYGCYFEDRDLTSLKIMSNVERLSIDGLTQASNLSELGALQKLKKLRIDVEDIAGFAWIDSLSSRLEQLSVHTKSKTLDISALCRFKQLKGLFLGGYKKNIEALFELKLLQKFTLSGITLDDFNFANNMPALRSLSILRGSTKNFSSLYGNQNIKALKLFRINHFTDMDLVCYMPCLEAVEICQLKNVTQFPDLSAHTALRHSAVTDAKALLDFSLLQNLNQLESFSVYCLPAAFEPEDILPLLKNQTVKQCSFYSGSEKKNQLVGEMIEQVGKTNQHNYSILREMLLESSEWI